MSGANGDRLMAFLSFHCRGECRRFQYTFSGRICHPGRYACGTYIVWFYCVVRFLWSLTLSVVGDRAVSRVTRGWTAGYMLNGNMQVQCPPSSAAARPSLTHHFFLLAISALTFLVHGYNPFADDAGLYVAGVEKLLDPTLFPVGMRFILSETRIESFYPLMAGVTKMLGGSLEGALLLLYLLT